MNKIGILGGAFDPPHIGHLIIAEEVRIALNLNEVWFIPTYKSPHKENTKTSISDRLHMLMESIKGNKYFKINKIEIDREGKSYTIDTIHSLTDQHQDSIFYFIIGADMVEYLPNWKKIDELMELITFVGINRRNYELKTNYPIKMINVPLIDISSTMIRNRFGNGLSAKYLVCDPVLNYIEEKCLYGYRPGN